MTNIENQIIRLASINAASRIADLGDKHLSERTNIFDSLKANGYIKSDDVMDPIFQSSVDEILYQESFRDF